MANVVIPENPEFNEALRIIETKDLVHAETQQYLCLGHYCLILYISNDG